jgi:hypothetical protein
MKNGRSVYGMKNGKPARNEDFITEWKAGGIIEIYRQGIEDQWRNEGVMTEWKAGG